VTRTDADLVAALRASDRTAFAELVTAWSGSMTRLAGTFVSTHASAEEVVQDTWLAVLKGLDGFAGRSAFRTWVYRILINTARRRGAREKLTIPWTSLRPLSDDRLAIDSAPLGHQPSPEAAALTAEFRAAVTVAVTSLPIRQRAVISLRDVEDHTSAEVCALLRISPANQRVLLHRARAAVRTHLAEYLATA
jgi:RNA polymerase sigma-70 factor (ECF subfamily)